MDAFDDALIGRRQPVEQITPAIIPLPDVDRGFHPPPQRAVVDLGMEPDDHPLIYQPLDPGARGIGAEPDPRPKHPLGETGVTLQFSEYFSVNLI